MGTDKRDRQKANKAARLAAEQAAEARQRRLRTVRNVVILVVGIIVVGVLLNLTSCANGGSDEIDLSFGASTTTTSTTATGDGTTVDGTTADTTVDGTTASSGVASYGTTPCPPAEGSPEPQIDFETGFAQCIDPAQTYVATVATTEGPVTVELDTTRTPITTNNFVALARYGYYDGTQFFRTEAQSGIIQGGAPHTQDNSDPGPGPEFSVPDEGLPFSADDYGPGTLAMARTSQPNSASGQFFFLANEGSRYLGEEASLGPDAGSYAVFGKVTEGLDVLEAITALDDGSSTPSKPVAIETVTITES